MVADIDYKILKEKVKQGAVLLDVRTENEFLNGYIDGAKNIPMHHLPKILNEIDKDKEVILYCHSGMRSLQGAKFLYSTGFSKVFNLKGGIISINR